MTTEEVEPMADPTDQAAATPEPGPAPPPHTGPVAGLFPGYFALVMATGIISIGAAQQEVEWLAKGLYAIAAAAYVVLVALTLLRLVRHPARLFDDLTSHARGFAFLTIVAGTNVLASASGVVHGWWDLAFAMWWASLGLWAVLLYVTLFSVVLKGPKPGLEKGLNGTWFLLTVSTESVAALGGLLILNHPGNGLAVVSLAAFALGFVLYLIVMTMVFLRWTFQELEPTEADPPAWIAAGAVAITVLAGSNLLGARVAAPRIDRVGPAIELVVLMAWSTATFWFPLMVAIGVWRHLIRKVPLRYHPSYWALVFPLGMYGAATFRMRAALELDELEWLPKVTLAVAGTAWALAFYGLLHAGVTGLARRRSRPAAATGADVPT
jgi:tellurite resistance protein TehA-like permease